MPKKTDFTAEFRAWDHNRADRAALPVEQQGVLSSLLCRMNKSIEQQLSQTRLEMFITPPGVEWHFLNQLYLSVASAVTWRSCGLVLDCGVIDQTFTTFRPYGWKEYREGADPSGTDFAVVIVYHRLENGEMGYHTTIGIINITAETLKTYEVVPSRQIISSILANGRLGPINEIVRPIDYVIVGHRQFTEMEFEGASEFRDVISKMNDYWIPRNKREILTCEIALAQVPHAHHAQYRVSADTVMQSGHDFRTGFICLWNLMTETRLETIGAVRRFLTPKKSQDVVATLLTLPPPSPDIFVGGSSGTVTKEGAFKTFQINSSFVGVDGHIKCKSLIISFLCPPGTVELHFPIYIWQIYSGIAVSAVKLVPKPAGDRYNSRLDWACRNPDSCLGIWLYHSWEFLDDM